MIFANHQQLFSFALELIETCKKSFSETECLVLKINERKHT